MVVDLLLWIAFSPATKPGKSVNGLNTVKSLSTTLQRHMGLHTTRTISEPERKIHKKCSGTNRDARYNHRRCRARQGKPQLKHEENRQANVHQQANKRTYYQEGLKL